MKSTGDVIKQEISTSTFSALEVNDNINVYLIQSQEQSVTIEAGKNLIPKINFEVIDGTLTIGNHNTCNWVREYKEIKVIVKTSQLGHIRQNGYGTIQSIGTFTTDTLTVEAFDTGDISLKLNTRHVEFDSYALCNISCEGKTSSASINLNKQDGQFQGKNFEAIKISVQHKGSNIIEVFPVESLEGKIHYNGDIIYYNKPNRISIEVLQNGKLINKSSQ